MEGSVLQLLAEAGIRVQAHSPELPAQRVVAAGGSQDMKPQNIVEMLALGRRDVALPGRLGRRNGRPTWSSCSTPGSIR
jgi:hypothetical protein